MAETPRFSHLFLLLFLGSGFFILVCLLLAAYDGLRKFRVAAILGAGGAFLGISGYGACCLGSEFSLRRKH
jgi:hypothetical protein